MTQPGQRQPGIPRCSLDSRSIWQRLSPILRVHRHACVFILAEKATRYLAPTRAERDHTAPLFRLTWFRMRPSLLLKSEVKEISPSGSCGLQRYPISTLLLALFLTRT